MHIQYKNGTIDIPNTITPKGRVVGLLPAYLPLTADGVPITDETEDQEDCFGEIEGYSVYYTQDAYFFIAVRNDEPFTECLRRIDSYLDTLDTQLYHTTMIQ